MHQPNQVKEVKLADLQIEIILLSAYFSESLGRNGVLVLGGIEGNLKEGKPDSLDAALSALNGLLREKMHSEDAEFRVHLAQLYHDAIRYTTQAYLITHVHD